MSQDVEKQTAPVRKMHKHLDMVNALLGGTDAMRAAEETYLPKWPAEEDAHYNFRRKTATLFPAFSRTVEALSGKPFSRPLKLSEDASDQMREWADDIDLQGRNFHSFAADVLEGAMARGLEGILIEYPRAEGVRTRADEISLGLRPYMVHITLGQILGYKTARTNGSWELTQLRFKETVHEEDGPFLEKEVEQIRVLEPGLFAIYRKDDKGKWFLYDEGRTSLNKIPFVPIYGQREAFMVGCPPLLDLCYLNVKHWQSQSAQDTILRVARVPILFFSGMEENAAITIGSKAITARDPQARGMFVEHSGHAIGSGRESLLDLEQQMRHAGAELLVDQPVKTVAQWSGEADAKMSGLKRITLDFQDALNQALQIMAEWVGEANVPAVSLFTDFGSLTLEDASAELLEKVGVSGGLSKQTLFEELQRRGLVRQDRTWEEEQERMSEEGPSLGAIGAE